MLTARPISDGDCAQRDQLKSINSFVFLDSGIFQPINVDVINEGSKYWLEGVSVGLLVQGRLDTGPDPSSVLCQASRGVS